ncbi:hypothetical protein AJ80_09086 [Polytolypa hystricis UAMH7299]|uniref:Rieske domain-containing protein n=1 Tax=Polytolypa hystricis (strain UAMH7299) TaxID=1447883 RepID=A0A2B7WNH0_POLH7|nr:hypothetical protein AJ80_09086 [Polytolypa hystricis UAMH7299]
MSEPQHFMHTTGENDPVWVHLMLYSEFPKFPVLGHNAETDVCVVGSGIAGISTAYEMVTRGAKVMMIEARDVLSGESGRTSGHLANALDDGYVQIAKKHGLEDAKAAADSHSWALNRVGDVSKKLGIECEYRHLPGYQISQYARGDRRHDEEVKGLRAEVERAKSLGLDVSYLDGFAVKGWDGKPDQRDAAIFANQATFHPTKYLVGVLKWLKEQPNFQCFTHTRMMSTEETGVEFAGLGHKKVKIHTENGLTITADHVVEATCVPLQKLSIIAEMEYYRTYCIAMRVPKGSIEDCLLYDEAEEYKYVRLTVCDENDDYLVIGGCDHKVGQGDAAGRFEELETWVRERFTRTGSVDYKWSGQIYEPVDYMGFIGKNQGQSNTYIVTGDSGNGLTHGVLAGKLIADEIQGIPNPWAKLYKPSRLSSIAKSLPSMLSHDVQINTQYKRYLQSDIQDIEDLTAGTGGVLNSKTSSPLAIYKDEAGKVHRYSAVCPHIKGVICWNDTEKTWDCPVHGSRFSKNGICVTGPAKANLKPADKSEKAVQQSEVGL